MLSLPEGGELVISWRWVIGKLEGKVEDEVECWMRVVGNQVV